MMRYADPQERESELLDLIVDSYIKESRPISSTYLCGKYKLPYSSATVRNVMESLEKQGFLCHLHTSSGRIPTKAGFKHYVASISEAKISGDIVAVDLSLYSVSFVDSEDIVNYTLDTLSAASGYTSLMTFSGKDSRWVFRGTRFMLEQPEFEDMARLRNFFYALEVKTDELQELMENQFDEDITILIGDDIGCEEIADCSLVVSGLRNKELSFALGVLGPMRMDYVRASSSVLSIRNQLRSLFEELV